MKGRRNTERDGARKGQPNDTAYLNWSTFEMVRVCGISDTIKMHHLVDSIY